MPCSATSFASSVRVQCKTLNSEFASIVIAVVVVIALLMMLVAGLPDLRINLSVTSIFLSCRKKASDPLHKGVRPLIRRPGFFKGPGKRLDRNICGTEK